METKTQKSFRFDGLGFPILLLDVPMLKVRGTWTPDIDYNELRAGVFEGMTLSPCHLTGNEIKFIRQYCRMTLQEFGTRFAVTHAAVKKWESAGNDPSNMRWAVEKDLRLFVLSLTKVKATDFRKAYQELATVKGGRMRRRKYSVPEAAVCQ